MIRPDGIDDILEMLSPRCGVSDVEVTETILTYLCAKVAEMSTENLRTFRARCLEMQNGVRNHAVVIEAVDWLLALRENGEGFNGRSLSSSASRAGNG